MRCRALLGAWLGVIIPVSMPGFGSWDLEKGAPDLRSPSAKVAEEPGASTNHVIRLDASTPHHTKLTVPGSDGVEDFQLSFRYRFLETSGAPPRIYVYGRDGTSGFYGLGLDADGRGSVIDYGGKDKKSESFGEIRASGDDGTGWKRVAFACVGSNLFAKVWGERAPEPRWQVVADGASVRDGRVAIGAWLSPQSPSSAKLLLDDIRFSQVAAAELALWLKPHEPRRPLTSAALPEGKGIFRADGRVGIATASMAIAFDEMTGEVADLIDRASGIEFIEARARRPLFEMQLARPREKESMTLSSADFARCRAQEISPRQLELEFTDGPVRGMVVWARARAIDSCQLALEIEVANESSWRVATVTYPQMPFALALGGDAADDCLLVPFQGGAVIQAPGTRRLVGSGAYPGGCPVPLYAYYDETSGLYVSPQDPGGRCKVFELRCDGRSVGVDIVHRFPETPQKSLRLPYEVIMATFEGDWRRAADRYRTWSVQRLWQCPTLNLRKDVPDFLKEGRALVIESFKGAENAYQKFGRDGERLVAMLDEYRARTGLKGMIFVPYGWEGRGTWAGINYLPAQPSNEYWSKVNALLESRGHRSAALLSGYWWVVKRRETSNGPAFDDTAQFDRMRDICIANADGSIWQRDAYDRVGQFGDWRGLSVALCHGSRGAADLLLERFLGVAKIGFPLLSFDQEIGGSQAAPCYSDSHGHAPGYGDWMWTGIRDLSARIREGARAFEPEFGLFMENECDLAVPLMSTYWSRQFGEVDIAGIAGARGVGLFSYIYHDYVTAIGAACVQGQGAQGMTPDIALRCRVLANNLTRGLIPGPFANLVPLETGNDPYKQASRDAFLSFCRPYARFPEYLLLGRCIPPAAIQSDQVETWYYRRKLSREETRDPAKVEAARARLEIGAVTCGAFEAANGSEAHFVVNGTPQPTRAVAKIRAGEEAVIYDVARKELFRVAPSAKRRDIPLDLEPFGVRVIEMR